MAKVFISYSRKDLGFAKKLTAELQKSELDFWIDWEGIPPTVDWWKEIEKGIEEADIFLFLISPDSAKSKVCGQEIDTAVKNGKRIVPIVVREIQWEDTPPQLGHLNYIFFSRDDDFNTAVKKLMTAIQTDYEWVAAHRRLQVKALEWERNRKEVSFLLRGKDLQDAEFELATNSSKEPHPTDLQREYVFNSRNAADKQRRLTTGVSIVAVISLAALAVFGLIQAGRATANANESQKNAATAQAASTLAFDNAATAVANEQEAKHQAQIALSRQLAAQAQPILATGDSRQTTAVLLAIQSMKIFPSGEAAQILQNNTLVHPDISKVFGGPVYTVIYSPDGKYVVIGGCGNTECTQGVARILDSANGNEIAHMSYDGPVYSVGFSPDGQYIISGGGSSAQVWETVTGKVISNTTQNNLVTSVAFSPDGKYVVVGNSSTAHVWEAMTGKEISHMTHEGMVTSVAFSPDGMYIVSTGDYTARVWEAMTGNEISHMTHEGIVTSVAFSPDGKYVASAGGFTIRVWEAATGQEVTRMPIDGLDNPLSAAFSPDGEELVIGAGIFHLEKAIVWDVKTGKQVFLLTHDDSLGYLQGAGGTTTHPQANSVAFSSDGKYIVSGGCDKFAETTCTMGSARVWDANTGRELARITCDGTVTSVAFSPNGKHIISGCEDGTFSIWTPGNKNGSIRITHKYHVTALAVSPDSRFVASGGGDGDSSVKVWDMENPDRDMSSHIYAYWVHILSFSPDSKFIVSGNDVVNVWEVENGLSYPYFPASYFIWSASFSPDGKFVVTTACDHQEADTQSFKSVCIQGSARIWEIYGTKEISRMTYDGFVYSAAFSPDNKLVVSSGCDTYDDNKDCSQSSTRIWDAVTGKEFMRVKHPGYISTVSFSPNGNFVITTGCEKYDPTDGCMEGAIRSWDVISGKEIFHVMAGKEANSIAISPDGKYLVAGLRDNSARVWEISTGKEISQVNHDGYISSVAFSPDGKFVASGSFDYTARVWDTMTGKEIARMTHDNAVTAVVFSPNGNYIVSAGDDGTTRVWMYRSEDLIADACSRITRNLTRDEWDQYIGNTLSYQAVCPNLPIETEATLTPTTTP